MTLIHDARNMLLSRDFRQNNKHVQRQDLASSAYLRRNSEALNSKYGTTNTTMKYDQRTIAMFIVTR